MNPSREESLFALALELPADNRAAFLAAKCEGDPGLRQRLEALLAAHEEPESLAGPNKWLQFDDAATPAEQVGSQVGRYKLLEKLGVGGFGEVWAAEQKEPVRRRVALKIIKLGMDTRQVVARFEAERQALAMMDHPNIARVLDAGATDTGRPYFVMDLVEGISITEYCEHKKLDLASRLDLFIKVCHAIQHAHQKGIIHRDIKPSNILVTLQDPAAAGVPKVIDFGIAKAIPQLRDRLTDHTAYTQLHQFIGTPAYMSPEQAEMGGVDIDTRSDIYSLGVLLYELLAGSTPFDAKELMAGGIDAMRKTIREKEPVRPSTKLTQALTLGVPPSGGPGPAKAGTPSARPAKAGTLNGEAARVQRLRTVIAAVQGDLDWIVMKCLEKDRQRRYDTANGLAADLKRYLDNEPVLARPPSAAYKFQKAVRRNKLVFAAGMAVATALLIGLTFSVWQAVRATRAEEKANEEKDNAQGALRFIQEDVLSQASPGSQPDRELTVRALLDRIAGRLDGDSKRPPLVEASIRQTLGSVYTELGDYAKAIEHYETALRIQREHLGTNHLDTLRSLNGLATVRWWGGETSLAEPLARQGLEASQRALGEDHALTLQFMQTRDFVVMLRGETPWTEVEALFLHTLALHRKVLGPDAPGTLRLIYSLGLAYNWHLQPDKGESLLVTALDRGRRVPGSEDFPTTSGLTIVLAYCYRGLDQPEKAETLALQAVDQRRRTLGTNHPLTMSSVCILSSIYVMQQQFDKARPLTEEVLDLSRRLPLEKDVYAALNLSMLGWFYLEQGDVARADTLCALAWQTIGLNPAANPLNNPLIIAHLGAVRLAQQNHTEATTLLWEGLRLSEKRDLHTGWRFYVMSLLGASLSGQKRYADAEPLLLQGYDGLVQRQASMPPYLNAPRRITEALERLVQLYDAWGKPAQAAEWKQKLAAFQQAKETAKKKQAKP